MKALDENGNPKRLDLPEIRFYVILRQFRGQNSGGKGIGGVQIPFL